MRSFHRLRRKRSAASFFKDPREETKSKPNGVGLILRGRRRERIKAQRSGFDFERKKEGADAQFSPAEAETERSELLLT